MYCLVDKDCSGVIGSIYGKTLGIKNEILGMLYYTTVAILDLILMFFPDNAYLGILLVLITLFATVFSLYLLYAQTIILKKLCSWCLIAIVLNLMIFISALKLIA